LRVFVDTWGLKALFDVSDRDHVAARLYRESVEKGEAGVTGFVTSDYILDEAMTLVRMDAGHKEAVDVLDSVQGSAFYEIHEVDLELFRAAADMFRNYADKEWSFTDCSSFVLMNKLGLQEAFTFDRNFEQAGFTKVPAILRDPGRRPTPSSSAPPAPAASPPPGTRATRRRPSTRARTPPRS
jgi:hypothetical protein